MSGIDKRELILSRLYAILQDFEGDLVTTVVRNRGELTAEERPAIELWDADEEFDADYSNKGRSRPAHSPSIMLARPKIYILLSTLDYTEIGPSLHSIRARILNAVMTDSELKSYCNDIYLERSFPDLDRGLTQKGEMLIGIVFQYALYPQQLYQ